MNETIEIQDKNSVIPSAEKLVKLVSLFSAIVLGLGASLWGLVAGDFDPFYSLVIIPSGFALAALAGVLWIRFVIAPVWRRRSRGSQP